jgi:hypothetical protein
MASPPILSIILIIDMVSLYLEACEQAKAETKAVAVGGAMSGQWTLAANLRGLDTLILDTMDDPDFVHDLMKYTVAFIKEWGAAVRETGIKMKINALANKESGYGMDRTAASERKRGFSGPCRLFRSRHRGCGCGFCTFGIFNNPCQHSLQFG